MQVKCVSPHFWCPMWVRHCLCMSAVCNNLKTCVIALPCHVLRLQEGIPVALFSCSVRAAEILWVACMTVSSMTLKGGLCHQVYTCYMLAMCAYYSVPPQERSTGAVLYLDWSFLSLGTTTIDHASCIFGGRITSASLGNQQMCLRLSWVSTGLSLRVVRWACWYVFIVINSVKKKLETERKNNSARPVFVRCCVLLCLSLNGTSNSTITRCKNA